jgi:hypothetical protein
MGAVAASMSSSAATGHWPVFAERARLEQCTRELERLGLTDGLPVVPPTVARLEQMLAGVSDPRVVRAAIPPLAGKLTVERAAYNAVLAGCDPSALDVVFAAVLAALDPTFNLLGIQTTTGTAAVAVILHGEAGIATGANAGSNCLGPGSRANATIGRAVQMTLRNVGGATPGVIDMATMGQPGKFTFCLAERPDDALLAPLPERLGMAAPDGAVSVLGASGTTEVGGIGMTPDGLAEALAAALCHPGGISLGAKLFGGGDHVVLIPPEITERFARDGWTPERLQLSIYEHGTIRSQRLPAATRRGLRSGGAGAAATMIRAAETPADIHLIATGGAGEKLTVLPTWPGGTRMVTRPVVPLAGER